MLLFVFLLQGAVVVVICLIEPPGATLHMPVATKKYVELTCNMPMWSLVIPLSLNLFLLLLCATFGFLTRKLPDNFNESWYIFISVSTTLFIWIAFLPTYILAFYAYHKSALLSLALNLNASITIMCLFAPKIYALFFVDDKLIKVTNFQESSFSMSSSVTHNAELSTVNDTKGKMATTGGDKSK